MICDLGACRKWYMGNVIRDILLADPQIYEQVGNHIYPIVAAENTKGDFIVYLRQKYSKLVAKQGVYQDECEVAVIAISENYDDALRLADNIDAALTGTHINDEDGCRVDILLADSTETFEDNKYIETLVFSIK